MSRVLRTSFVAGGVWLSAAPSAAVAPITRTVYVTVTDGKGAFVTDLTAADFTVKEGGNARPVVKVEPVTGPMDIALLVDQGLSGHVDVRQGVYDCLRRAREAARISLIVVEMRNKTLVDYTSDLNALVQGFGAMPVVPGLAHHVGEGVHEAARAVAGREAPRRIIVVVAIEGQHAVSMRPDTVVNELRQSGATLHAATLTRETGAGYPALRMEQAALGQILDDGTRQSGGRQQVVTILSGMPRALQQIADEILHQHVLTYELPEGVKPDSHVSVSMPRKGFSVRAPTRVPDR